MSRYAAVSWSADEHDGGDDAPKGQVGVLASHVRLRITGRSAGKPSWSQLQVFGIAGPRLGAESVSSGGVSVDKPWSKPSALSCLTQVKAEEGHGVTQAFAFGLTPPPGVPTQQWQVGTLLCVAIDTESRSFGIKAVTEGAKGKGGWSTEWVRFPFPRDTAHFADGRVTPALTLAPGVELEILAAVNEMKHKKAPGDGYKAVVGGIAIAKDAEAPKA